MELEGGEGASDRALGAESLCLGSSRQQSCSSSFCTLDLLLPAGQWVPQTLGFAILSTGVSYVPRTGTGIQWELGKFGE